MRVLIDDFIQQDVLRFLNGFLEKTERHRSRIQEDDLYLNRDFEKELLAALDRNDLQEAKRVLHALKERFDEVPVGTPEKEHLKFLLQTLYDKFRSHLEADTTFTAFDRTLRKMERSQQAAPQRTAGSRKRGDPRRGEREELRGQEEITRLLERSEQALRAGEIGRAVQACRDARRVILGLPGSVPGHLAVQFKEVFGRIRAAVRKRKEERASLLDRDLLLQLEREKHHLDVALQRDDVAGAMRTYSRMRILAQQMHDPRMAESAAKKLVTIYNIINRIRQHGQVRP